jgi:hypothetical protein
MAIKMVSSLEVDETTTSNIFRIRLPSDRVSYQRRMETSATLLQKPKSLKVCMHLPGIGIPFIPYISAYIIS